MLYIQYTGKGWLTYALFASTVAASVLLGLTVMDVTQDRLLGAGVTGVAIAAGGAAVQWLVGRGLNGAVADRPWDAVEHTTYGIPMELAAPFYPVIGLPMVAFAVGQATAPVWGWLLFVGVGIPGALAVRGVLRRRAEQGR